MMMIMSALSCTFFLSLFSIESGESFLGFRRRPVFLANNNNKQTRKKERKHNEQHTLHSSKRLVVDVLFVDMGTKTKPTSSSSSDTTPRADSSAEKTSSKSSSFSLEPIVKPKIKWSAADLPEISPVAPFLISEDEREAGAASSKQSS